MGAIFKSVFVLSVQAGHNDKINSRARDSIVVNETSPGNYTRGWGMGGEAKMLTAKCFTMTAILPELLNQQVLRYCWRALHLAATDKNLLEAAG